MIHSFGTPMTGSSPLRANWAKLWFRSGCTFSRACFTTLVLSSLGAKHFFMTRRRYSDISAFVKRYNRYPVLCWSLRGVLCGGNCHECLVRALRCDDGEVLGCWLMDLDQGKARYSIMPLCEALGRSCLYKPLAAPASHAQRPPCLEAEWRGRHLSAVQRPRPSCKAKLSAGRAWSSRGRRGPDTWIPGTQNEAHQHRFCW